jgi:hypothetical protein
MNRHWLIAFVVAVALAALVVVRVRGGEPPAAIDLMARLGDADRRPHDAPGDLFAVSKVTIDGDARRAVLVRPTTRITWDLTLPNRAFLRTAMGLHPSARSVEGDGVQFRVGVSVGPRFDPLLTRRLDPRHAAADRGWVPVVIDLTRYSGQRVHIVLATDPGLPRSPNTDDDLAYWAAPAITLR